MGMVLLVGVYGPMKEIDKFELTICFASPLKMALFS